MTITIQTITRKKRILLHGQHILTLKICHDARILVKMTNTLLHKGNNSRAKELNLCHFEFWIFGFDWNPGCTRLHGRSFGNLCSNSSPHLRQNQSSY